MQVARTNRRNSSTIVASPTTSHWTVGSSAPRPSPAVQGVPPPSGASESLDAWPVHCGARRASPVNRRNPVRNPCPIDSLSGPPHVCRSGQTRQTLVGAALVGALHQLPFDISQQRSLRSWPLSHNSLLQSSLRKHIRCQLPTSETGLA